jgi:hypothetical protein
MCTVDHLKAENLVIALGVPHCVGNPPLESALDAARKVGVGHVEIIDGNIVVALAGEPVQSAGNGADGRRARRAFGFAVRWGQAAEPRRRARSHVERQ